MADFSSERAGHRIAVDLLRRLRREWADQDFTGIADAQIGETMLDREPKLLRGYVEMMRNCPPATERGFMCVLNTFLGAELQNLDDVYLRRRFLTRPAKKKAAA